MNHSSIENQGLKVSHVQKETHYEVTHQKQGYIQETLVNHSEAETQPAKVNLLI